MTLDISIVFLMLAGALSALSILIFLHARSYRSKLLQVEKEYKNAKNLVKNIVLNFKSQQEEQEVKIDSIAYGVEDVNAKVEILNSVVDEYDEELKRLAESVRVSLLAESKLGHHVLAMYERIQSISSSQDALGKKLSSLEKLYQGLLPETELPVSKVVEKRDILAGLTKTERQILTLLIAEGEKTSPEIEKIIGKTREHTSRLMRKLFLEGYVERDTHKIPYTYRINEKLKSLIQVRE